MFSQFSANMQVQIYKNRKSDGDVQLSSTSITALCKGSINSGIDNVS